jgi:hypothetical protein
MGEKRYEAKAMDDKSANLIIQNKYVQNSKKKAEHCPADF